MEAFAKELAEVRNLDTKDTYKEQLDKLETETSLSSYAHSLSFTKRWAALTTCEKGFTSSKSSFVTPIKVIPHTPPTYLSLGLTKTSRLAATVNVTHCGSDSSQTNCAVRTVGSLNPWMASRLITMNSIIVVGTTRLSNEDEPTDPTTSDITLTNI